MSYAHCWKPYCDWNVDQLLVYWYLIMITNRIGGIKVSFLASECGRLRVFNNEHNSCTKIDPYPTTVFTRYSVINKKTKFSWNNLTNTVIIVLTKTMQDYRQKTTVNSNKKKIKITNFLLLVIIIKYIVSSIASQSWMLQFFSPCDWQILPDRQSHWQMIIKYYWVSPSHRVQTVHCDNDWWHW
jgi:hypothetical protein